MNNVTIVLPCYNEVGNVPILVSKLRESMPNCEIIVVDDSSPDGTAGVAENVGCRVIVRKERNLGTAIIDGIKAAKTEYVLAMDADLSHRPEDAVRLLSELDEGYDLVIGSRFIKGGMYKAPLHRRIITQVGVLPARVFTGIHDTGTGFFALNTQRVDVDGVVPMSWKALLEIYARCNVKRVKEVPITFEKRFSGYSKATFKYFLLNVLHFLYLLASFTLPKFTRETDEAVEAVEVVEGDN